MSLYQTPRTVKTRAQLKKDLMATGTEEVTKVEVKADVQFYQEDAAKRPKKHHILDMAGPPATQHNDGASKKSFRASSIARQKRLEYEAAQAKAIIDLEAAQAQAEMTLTKARIKKELLQKKLAADLAELEENSRCSKQGSSVSANNKVQEWLEQSVVAPGSVLDSHPNERQHMDQLQCPTTNIAIEALTSAINNAVGAATPRTHNRELLSRLATSKDLPLYFGDPMEWLQFKEAFYESTRLCNYSDTENLWRLRKCLRGEAKEVASSLLMSVTSPQDIMETLELRFGRPENIMRQVTSQFKKLQPLPQAYHTQMVNFAIKIKNLVTTTKTIKQNDYLKGPELVTIVVSKLPTALINKWAEYLYTYENQEDIPKLEILSKFLYQEAQKIAMSGVSYVHSQDEFKKKTNFVQKNNHHQPVLVCADVNNVPDKCNFCRKQTHILAECGRFKRAMRKDRWRYVRVNKLCFKCLGNRHKEQSECTAANCDIESCGGPHHCLLHWMKPEATSQTTSAP